MGFRDELHGVRKRGSTARDAAPRACHKTVWHDFECLTPLATDT